MKVKNTMTKRTLMVVGIMALLLCVVFLILAYNRYHEYRNNLAIIQNFFVSSDEVDKVQSHVPKSVYGCLILALIAGIGGGISLRQGLKKAPEPEK
jgi:hypothetical protein